MSAETYMHKVRKNKLARMVNKYNLIKGDFYHKKLDLVLFLAY